jgi:hypothetical protein
MPSCYHDEAEVGSWSSQQDQAVIAKRRVVTKKLATQGNSARSKWLDADDGGGDQSARDGSRW